MTWQLGDSDDYSPMTQEQMDAANAAYFEALEHDEARLKVLRGDLSLSDEDVAQIIRVYRAKSARA